MKYRTISPKELRREIVQKELFELKSEAHDIIYELRASGLHKNQIYARLRRVLNVPRGQEHFRWMVTVSQVERGIAALIKIRNQRDIFLRRQQIFFKKQLAARETPEHKHRRLLLERIKQSLNTQLNRKKKEEKISKTKARKFYKRPVYPEGLNIREVVRMVGKMNEENRRQKLDKSTIPSSIV